MMSFLTKKNLSYSVVILVISSAVLGAFLLLRAGEHGSSDVGDNIVPHRALYEITLSSARSGSQIVNVSGKVLYEGQMTCDAWKTSQKFDVVYEYVDNKVHKIINNFAAFETFDGHGFDFTSKRKLNGKLSKQTRGHAFKEKGSPPAVTFTAPEALEMDLPEKTLFPMEHTLAVLEHIRTGDGFFKSIIFDGGDSDGPVEVSTFIGGRVNVDFEENVGLDTELLNSPAHHIRLAFFSLVEPDSIPDYEVSMVFHENGVISDMNLEYEDFSVSQKLVALERLEHLCPLGK